MKFADEEILLYDLSNRPASFDFVTCLATAIAFGCKHVRFVLNAGWKPKNYERPVNRFLAIVEPAVALYGMDYSVGERRGIEINHMLRAAIETYKHKGCIGKMAYPCEARDYITITLRKSRNPERDSNEPEWMRFAEICGEKTVIIPDSETEPLPLAKRMMLYAGAKMNFMVMNGPATLCFHSDAPYIVMRTIGCEKSGSTSPAFSAQNGITPSFQFPWAHSKQTLSYLDDTCENIEAEWAKMQDKQLKAA